MIYFKCSIDPQVMGGRGDAKMSDPLGPETLAPLVIIMTGPLSFLSHIHRCEPTSRLGYELQIGVVPAVKFAPVIFMEKVLLRLLIYRWA